MNQVLRNREPDSSVQVQASRIRIQKESTETIYPLRIQWAQLILSDLKFELSHNNIITIVAWETAEGGGFGNEATNNPINSTQPYGGSYPINPVGVQAYPTYADGIQSTINTLNNGYYSNILTGLREGLDPTTMASIIGSSPWGTNGTLLAECVLQATSAVDSYIPPPQPAPKPKPINKERSMQFIAKSPDGSAICLFDISSQTYWGLTAEDEVTFYESIGIPHPTTVPSDVYSKYKRVG